MSASVYVLDERRELTCLQGRASRERIISGGGAEREIERSLQINVAFIASLNI